MSIKNKKKFVVLLILSVFVAYFMHRYALNYAVSSGEVVQKINTAFERFFPTLQAQPFNFSFTSQSLQWAGIAFIGGVLFALYVGFDEKKYRFGKEYGSSVWATKKELAPHRDKTFSKNLIFSQTEHVSTTKELGLANNNFVAIGGAGSWKTTSIVKPNGIQGETSYVITESKGLLPHHMGKFYVENGYRFKVFDLNHMENSDFFNPFVYMRREEDILKIADTFMKNTDDGGIKQKTGDPFWDKAEKALYSALFGLLKEFGSPEEQTFSMVADLVREGKMESDDMAMKSTLDMLFKDLSLIDPESFIVKEWNTFQIAPFKTKSSILMCASVRLAPFDIPSVARLTSKDTLELDTLGDEKTVLFVCLSDTSGTFNFLSAIMFKVLFESLVYKADEFYRGELPIPVQCILDEWANIGQIPEFEKLMSTIRSRGISVGIILQALSQLKRLHKDSWEEIMGNCSTLVYLGGKEESTHKYISKLLGKETIDTLSYSRSYGAQGSYTKQMNRTGRELLTSDEVAGIPKDKCIVITAENLKYLSSKYDLKKHPNYHYLYDANKENWYDYQISYSPVEEFLMNTATLEIFDHEVFKAA